MTRRHIHKSVGSSYTIFDKSTGAAIGTIDGMRVFKECHPGAIYLHMSKQYVVESIDIEHRDIIGGICYPVHPQIGKTAIFIYDGHPGGVGLAKRGFDIISELLRKTLDHICDEGCPSCIHSPKCGSGNNPLDKKSAISILEFLLGDIPVDSFYKPEKQGTYNMETTTEVAVKSEKLKARILFFDLETQKLAQEVGGWNNCHLMRISVAVVYDSLEKQFFTFTEDKIEKLLEHFKKADLIVGFNVNKFDYKVLSAYTSIDLLELPTFDILEAVYKQLGFRLGLDNLAKEIVNHGKSADGLKAVEWFRQGDMESITKYCIQDVAATRDLFYYGLEKGHLKYRTKKGNKKASFETDWDLNEMIKQGTSEF